MNKKEAEKISFEEHYKQRIRLRMSDECSITGIAAGLVLAFTGIYQSLCSVGLACVIFNIMICAGVILVVLGGFFPLLIEKPVTLFKRIFSVIGRYMLRVLVAPVYVFLVIINIFGHRRYADKFAFYSWKDSCDVKTSFYDYADFTAYKKKHVAADITSRVIRSFINNGMYILVPIVIILLAFGTVLFFASSNAVFSFIYTLF